MLETIREFGRERLAETGELDATATAHADRFAALAEQAEPALTAGREWPDRLERRSRQRSRHAALAGRARHPARAADGRPAVALLASARPPSRGIGTADRRCSSSRRRQSQPRRARRRLSDLPASSTGRPTSMPRGAATRRRWPSRARSATRRSRSRSCTASPMCARSSATTRLPIASWRPRPSCTRARATASWPPGR